MEFHQMSYLAGRKWSDYSIYDSTKSVARDMDLVMKSEIIVSALEATKDKFSQIVFSWNI